MTQSPQRSRGSSGGAQLSQTPPPRGRSLVARLVFTFLALSLLMVTAVGAISYLRARSSLQSQVFNRLQAAEQLKADSVDRWIDEQRRNAVFVGGFLGGNLSGDASGLGKAIQIVVDRRASPAARAKARLRLGTGLQYIVGQTADAQELLILDLSGRVVVSTLAAHDGRNFSKQRWFQQGSRTPTSIRSHSRRLRTRRR